MANSHLVLKLKHLTSPLYVQGGPFITANLYCICLSEHEACASADAIHICGSI